MQEIHDISRELCDFGGDYAVKIRTVSKQADIRVWLRNIDYENFQSRARVSYYDRVATFSAWTNGNDQTKFTIKPQSALRWLSMSLAPSPQGFFTGSIALQHHFVFSERFTSFGMVSFAYNDKLPYVKCGLKYQHPFFCFTANPEFRDVNGTFKLAGTTSFSVFYDNFVAKLIYESSDNEGLLGIRFDVKNATAGLITSSKEAVNVSFESKIGKHWRAGFRCTQLFSMQESIWKVMSSMSLGARYSFKGGYIGLSWQRPNSVSAKAKYLVKERYEVAGFVNFPHTGFSKGRLGMSFCLYPGSSTNVSDIS